MILRRVFDENMIDKTLLESGAIIMKSSRPSAEFDANIGIFGLKTPLHAYTLV